MKILLLVLMSLPSVPVQATQCVVLLHGLLRSSASMEQLATAISQEGYQIANIDYQSRSARIENLAERVVPQGIEQCSRAEVIHFVTHSMGGILVRQYFENHSDRRLGRVVMLGPPNQGTSVVNALEGVPGAVFVLGPAGSQLGRGEKYLPDKLNAVEFELGVIAGTRAFNPFLSLLVEDPDDGTVTVESTKVTGMCAHLELPATHFLMMLNEEVVGEVISFLKYGEFNHPQARNHLCKPQTDSQHHFESVDQ